MPDILIVEDDEHIARFLELELCHEGYSVSKAPDGRTGLSMACSGGFDLIVLDIMLPGLNGLEVLRRLRKESDVPVILLTARDAVADKVSGLDLGADDYLTKPFAIEELLARVRVLLRKNGRRPGSSDGVLTWEKLTVNVPAHEAVWDGQDLGLTSREFSLLQVLLENRNIVLGRDTLLERVWGYDYVGETNVVDVYIRYLRQKIDERFDVRPIQTVRGVGYVIKDA